MSTKIDERIRERLEPELELKEAKKRLVEALSSGMESELIMDRLHDVVLRAAEAEIFTDRITNEFRLTEGNSKEFVFAEADQISFEEIAAGAQIPMAEEAYTSRTITVKKYGVRSMITREMIEDSHFDVLAYHLEQLGRAAAVKKDSLWFTAADAGVAAESMNFNSAGSEVAAADFSKAIYYLEKNNYKGTHILMSPKQAWEVRDIDDFNQYQIWGTNEMWKTGFIGEIYGLPILRSSRVADDKVYVIDARNAVGCLIRRPLTITRIKDDIYDLVGAVATMRLNYFYIHGKAIARIDVQ